jgi:hypothetical protein
MAKLTATILATMAGTAAAFVPPAASGLPKSTTIVAPLLGEFANGMVGGEGPEPMPFNFGGEKTSKNFDPVGFSEVSFPSLAFPFRFAAIICPFAGIACGGAGRGGAGGRVVGGGGRPRREGRSEGDDAHACDGARRASSFASRRRPVAHRREAYVFSLALS